MAEFVTITIFAEDEQNYLNDDDCAFAKLEQIEAWLQENSEVKEMHWVEGHTFVCSLFGVDQYAFLEFVRTRNWSDEQFLLTFREHYEGRQHPDVYVLRAKFEDQKNLKGYLGHDLKQVDLNG